MPETSVVQVKIADLPEVVAVMRCAQEEITRLRQALWDVYATLGFDTDGDPTPAAVRNLENLVVSAAEEARKDYDEALTTCARCGEELRNV